MPDIKWGENTLFTSYLFRAWEWLAWRPFGPNGVGDTIRCESSTEAWQDENGNLHIHRNFYTIEAVVTHIEGTLRNAFSKAFEPRPELGYISQPVYLTLMILGVKLSLQGDLNGMIIPLIGGAIAYDSSSKNIGTTNSLTVSHTTSGSNRLLITGGVLQDSSRSWSSVTYNGDATTQIGSNFTYTANNAPGQMRYKIAPATGTNNAVFTCSGSIQMRGIVASYTGCLQSGVPDGTAQGNGGSSFNVTVTLSNCWMVSVTIGFNNDFDTPGPAYVTPGGALTTLRQFYDDGLALADSNGTVSTGSIAVEWTGLNSNNGRIAASIAPVANTEYTQAVTATAVASVSISDIASFLKTLTVTALATASLIKQAQKTITTTAQVTVSQIKQLYKELEVTAIGEAIINASRVFLQSLTATASAVVSITKQGVTLVTLEVTAAATATVSMIKSFIRTISATASATASIVTGYTLSKVLEVTASATVSITKGLVLSMELIVTAVGVATTTVQKALSMTISVVASGIARLVRDFGYTDKYPRNEVDYEDKYPTNSEY